MRGSLPSALAACVLLGCGAGDEELPPPADVVTVDRDDNRLDASADDVTEARDTSTPEELPAPIDAPLDAPRDAPRDVAMDAPRDAPRDAPVDAPVDAPRDVPRDTMEPVPRPGTVAAGAECHALLRRIGVRFTVASATRGIVDPVTVTTPINGVSFRYASFTAAERPMLMDCRLGVALWHLTDALRTRWNIDTIMHIGIYNYRVIAGSTTLSQHAYATAIDLGGFRATNGTTYSVLTDFTMNGQPTCPPRSTSARDRVLKEIACWMYDSRSFNIILTPNYNADHRNHYHVDLTTGSHTIRYELPGGVDPEHSPLFDWLYDDE